MHNFNAGPSVLPQIVFEEASKAVVNFNNSGLSILEIGHRTPLFETVMNDARSLVRELMQLDEDHEVLFLHGGATTQFMQIPMNLLNENEVAAYTETDIWGTKGIKEAKLFGHVEVVCSSKDANFNYLPKQFTIPKTAKYLHLTTNNTIYGTQWQDLQPFYDCGVPLVADMSSDVFSRVIDFNKFDLIYAGAQKNIGAAGVNLVVINKNLLGKVDRKIPSIMDYRNHIDQGSMLNTPPVFAVFVCMLTLKWLRNAGGVAAMETNNKKKAGLLYDTLDNSGLFKANIGKEDRSRMNACFTISDKEIEKKFMDACKENNFYGVKGHRSTGGFRISMYNALPYESVVALTDLMKEFESKHG